MKKLFAFSAVLTWFVAINSLRASIGATVPWTTYEAENMATTGFVSGPSYLPGIFATAASGRKSVDLYVEGQYVEFTATNTANSLIVRYCVPDSPDGSGADYTLSLYTNGVFARKLTMTSKYSWLYGYYPFNNDPNSGLGRNFFDEVRVLGIALAPGDVVRLQKDASDTADNYEIDLVDLENVADPLTQPANSLSLLAYGADPTGVTNSTTALLNCLAAANSQSKTVWAPAGTYKITASINLPANTKIQGAGMWHTTFEGDPAFYGISAKRVTFNGNGSNIHLADFSILGKLTYRNDSEPNDGIGGSYGTGSTISRIWVEHTKTGAWIVNSQGLVVDGCRFRNTIADGINLAVGMRGNIVTNCTARGTGDDCFAIWPATYISQTYTPGLNRITHCTAQVPFLANGCGIYGGVSNTVENCLFQDISYASGVLISTTFPVGGNVFSGITTVCDCDVNRCGGQDPSGTLRGAFVLFLDNSSLAGIRVSNCTIRSNLCDGFDVIAPGSNPGTGLGTLSNAILSNVIIPDYGWGFYGSDGLWADGSALGSLTVTNSTIVDVQNYSLYFTFVFGPLINSLQRLTIYPDGPVVLGCNTTPSFIYHLESTTNLNGGVWEPVSGSEVYANGSFMLLYDFNSPAADQRFYRSVSP